jgi:hypothetical protein
MFFDLIRPEPQLFDLRTNLSAKPRFLILIPNLLVTIHYLQDTETNPFCKS